MSYTWDNINQFIKESDALTWTTTSASTTNTNRDGWQYVSPIVFDYARPYEWFINTTKQKIVLNKNVKVL